VTVPLGTPDRAQAKVTTIIKQTNIPITAMHFLFNLHFLLWLICFLLQLSAFTPNLVHTNINRLYKQISPTHVRNHQRCWQFTFISQKVLQKEDINYGKNWSEAH